MCIRDRLIAVAPEQIASAATTGKWEKALNDMAVNPDAALRAQKRERFLLGIRRFAIFLVNAAKTAPADMRFEREKPRAKKTARRATSRSGGATQKPAARKASAPKRSAPAPKGGERGR